MKRVRLAVLGAVVLSLTGCGASELTGVAPYGAGPRYRPDPDATGPGCADRSATGRVHVELFAAGKVMILPAGIGIADPRIDGAYARGGRCRHALFTTEPTGVVDVARPRQTLGDLFDIWDRPLATDRLLSFRAPVQVHVDGERWDRDPRAVPLTDEAQIVVQAGGPPVEPHAEYTFPA